MHNYKDLLIWKKSMTLVVDVYKLVKTLPKEETYALSDQMRRAAVSIPSNISEGSMRDSDREFIRFLTIAQGLCAELNTQLLICLELGFIEEKKAQPVIESNEEVSRMIKSFIDTLKKAID